MRIISIIFLALINISSIAFAQIDTGITGYQAPFPSGGGEGSINLEELVDVNRDYDQFASQPAPETSDSRYPEGSVTEKDCCRKKSNKINHINNHEHKAIIQ